jgi:predicted AAA+ superfamily ATPase
MMKLDAWRLSSRRKPLILEGARQVGKTWLMREFARTRFENVVYARFDKDRVLRRIFERDFDVNRIVGDLEVLFHTRVKAGETILLFDEIQSCKNALTSLKYFCEDRPDLHVMAAGSLLGLTYRNDVDDDAGTGEESTGFPVGKVNTIRVYPLTFNEFLIAMGEMRLAEEIKGRNWEVLEDLNEVVATWLRRYYVVGGMPEAVAAYAGTRNFIDARAVHREILSGYLRDISKHAPKADMRKIEMCWQSIPAQLAKENKKFLFASVRKGGRAAEFRDPLAWLEDAGLISLNRRVSAPHLPLAAHAGGAFKVYMLDVGLLAAMSGLDPGVVLQGSRIFMEFKGALTEQYVHQQLAAETEIQLYYWSTDDSRTEVDFVFQKGMEVCPLEVKAEGNVRSQSLKSYERRFRPKTAYRVSMLPYKEQDVPLENGEFCRLVNIPLYAVSNGVAAPFPRHDIQSEQSEVILDDLFRE